MKIHIWIKKKDVLSGKITKYYSYLPLSETYTDWVQVSITVDEFVKLEDSETDTMGPAIPLEDMNDLENRIYAESQSTTGGEFSNWYNNLTAIEKQTYSRIYGH